MKKTSYDKYYLEKDYFGKPYEGLVDYFKTLDKKYKILDLGCGQGRDSLFLGRLGFNVKGIDISKVGIEQLNKVAQKENLSVVGVVDDIYNYKITDDIDLVLLDSMLHFYKNDKDKETDLIKRVAMELKKKGILCNLMLKNQKNEKYLKDILERLIIKWTVLNDDYVDYPEAECRYHM